MPAVRVYGVEPEAMPSMQAAIGSGVPVDVPTRKTIADGAAVGRVGDRTLEVARRYLDGMITVDEEELAAAILMLLETEKTVSEGAGAAPLAAFVESKLSLPGKKVAIVISGGNVDVNLLSRVIDRGLIKTGRLMRLQMS